MIKETFGFGVQEVSFEGAGKMYEVLASNVAGQAATAGAEKATALSDHNRAMASFNKHFQGSQNTAQAANAAISEGNRAMNRGVDALNHSARLSLQENIRTAGDYVSIVNALHDAGKVFDAYMTKTNLQEGAIVGKKRHAEINLMQDPSERLAAIDEVIDTYQQDPTAFNKSVYMAVTPLYVGATEAVDVVRREEGIGNMILLANESLDASGDKLSTNYSALVKHAKDNNLNMSEFNTAYYAVQGRVAEHEFMTAQTPEQFKEAQEKWMQVQKNNFNNNQFIKSKSAPMVKTVAQADASINKAIKQKEHLFVLQAKGQFTQALNNPTSFNGEEVFNIIKNITDDPLAQDAKIEEFGQAWTTRDQMDRFYLDNMDLHEPTSYNKVPISEDLQKGLKDRIQAEVTDVFLEDFANGDFAKVEKLLLNKSEYTKKAGKVIYEEFMTSKNTPEQLEIADNLVKLSRTPQGWKMLSQAMGAGKLAEITAIGTVAKIAYGGDIEAAREKVTQAAKVGVKISMDMDYKKNLLDQSMDLGPDAGAYNLTMRILQAADPSLADEMQGDIHSNIANSQTKIIVGGNKGMTGLLTTGGQDITVYTSMAPDYIAGTPGGMDGAVDKEMAYNTAIEMFRREHPSSNPTRFRMLPGNTIRIADPITNKVLDIDSRDVIQKSDMVSRRHKLYSDQIDQFNKKASGTITNTGDSIMDGVNYVNWTQKYDKKDSGSKNDTLERAAHYANKMDMNRREFESMLAILDGNPRIKEPGNAQAEFETEEGFLSAIAAEGAKNKARRDAEFEAYLESEEE